ncbi:hypothetical protein BYT27DRAFT_7106103 [Phlegmacium glaucopus]|nr:hypothetical protein BYT27DRAFT_7106103 [Phlegmacium glaucopus]
MKVCWSSTLVMLQHCQSLKLFINNFVYEMGQDESNHSKQMKIDMLKLTDDEWTTLENPIDHANKYQQTFSHDSTPSLHTAIPALEKIHKAWSSHITQSKYAPFVDGLTAGVEKINEYYNKTTMSHAYTFVMLLDPNSKMDYFKTNWDKELQDEVLKSAETIVHYYFICLFLKF